MFRKPPALVSVLLLLSFSLPTFAQIYKWVDEEGRTQFGQFPPSSTESSSFQEVKSIQTKNHRYQELDGSPYCGKRKLPENEDPVYELIEVTSQIDNWKNQLERSHLRKSDAIQEKNKNALRNRGSSISSNRAFQNRINNFNDTIADLECAIAWGKKQQIELQETRDKFLEDYKKAEDNFAAFKNSCGPKPDIEGYTTDPRAKEWMRCEQSKSINEHNKKLRELKHLRSLAKLLD